MNLFTVILSVRFVMLSEKCEVSCVDRPVRDRECRRTSLKTLFVYSYVVPHVVSSSAEREHAVHSAIMLRISLLSMKYLTLMLGCFHG